MTENLSLTRPVSRRRVIGILAMLAAAPLAARVARAVPSQRITWRGIALGAEASLELEHPSEAEAKAAIADCLAEISRLEAIFSLHRPDSALVSLNMGGVLRAAPLELRALLSEALRLAQLSDGAFDPTVQPLWALYRDHFKDAGAPSEGPTRADLDRTRALVDWRAVTINGSTIRLENPGMAVTLNGIAQGYITDRVGDLLEQRGFLHVLANLGEERALGPRWDGTNWVSAIGDPFTPGRTLAPVELSRGAIATSSPHGFRFDMEGRFTHILDPHTARPSQDVASVTVLAERATVADGVSTAIAASGHAQAEALARKSGVRAYLLDETTRHGRWLG